MSKLTKLTIKKFRNVAPTTLEFRPGINVILGKNAAGKTSLLRLLSTALGVREGALKDDVLEVSYRASGHSFDFEHTITRSRVSEPVLPLELGRTEMKNISSFQQTDHFAFEQNGAVVVSAEVLPNQVVITRPGHSPHRAQRWAVDPAISASVAVALAKTSEMSKPGISLSSARIASAGRMDESLGQFDALLGGIIFLSEDSKEFDFGGFGDVPRSMISMPLDSMPDGNSAEYKLGFLEKVASVLGYDSANARFDIDRFSPAPNRQMVRLSNPRFFFKRSGEEISHDLLSYGQKRLLSFFAHADASQDVIIADELVNGLHHEWISACLEEIGQRQAFLTSQNPLLLDFLRFDSAEEVRRTFILCERESRESGAQLIWRNPTQEEAESFFAAYQTGIQRVSDILLTKGLW